jgi:hypothetical protein
MIMLFIWHFLTWHYRCIQRNIIHNTIIQHIFIICVNYVDNDNCMLELAYE